MAEIKWSTCQTFQKTHYKRYCACVRFCVWIFMFAFVQRPPPPPVNFSSVTIEQGLQRDVEKKTTPTWTLAATAKRWWWTCTCCPPLKGTQTFKQPQTECSCFHFHFKASLRVFPIFPLLLQITGPKLNTLEAATPAAWLAHTQKIKKKTQSASCSVRPRRSSQPWAMFGHASEDLGYEGGFQKPKNIPSNSHARTIRPCTMTICLGGNDSGR